MLARSSTLLPAGRRILAAASLAIAVSGMPGTAFASPTPTPVPVYVTPDDLGNGKPAPTPVAESWLVANVTTGEVIDVHGEDVVSSPASVQKLLTALALVDELPDKKKKYRAKEADVAIDGTRVGLLRDNEYSIDLLFHAMLMSSANDAAHALGEAVGGQDKALKLMNAKAHQLGMTSTYAGTTSGLDAPGQGTTVVDLLKLTHEFVRNDYLMGIVGTQTLDFPGGFDHDKNAKVPGFQIQNHTRVVGNVEGGLGLKNGYTQKARGTFVGVAKRGSTTYAAIVLRAENHSRQSAIDLLDWAFNQKDPQVTHTVSFAVPTTAPPSRPVTTVPPGTPGAEVSQAGSVNESAGRQPETLAGVPVGLAIGVPVALFAVASGAFVYRSRKNRSR